MPAAARADPHDDFPLWRGAW